MVGGHNRGCWSRCTGDFCGFPTVTRVGTDGLVVLIGVVGLGEGVAFVVFPSVTRAERRGPCKEAATT